MKKKIEMKTRKYRGWLFASASVVMLIISGVAAGGYFEIKLEEIAPPNSTELSIDEVKEILPEFIVSLLNEMPNYNDVFIKIYSTDQTSFEILKYYDEQLNNSGFECVKRGMFYFNKEKQYLSAACHCGDSIINYQGYTRGLVAIGIIVLSDGGPDSICFYTTGFIAYYQSISYWLQHLDG